MKKKAIKAIYIGGGLVFVLATVFLVGLVVFSGSATFLPLVPVFLFISGSFFLVGEILNAKKKNENFPNKKNKNFSSEINKKIQYKKKIFWEEEAKKIKDYINQNGLSESDFKIEDKNKSEKKESFIDLDNNFFNARRKNSESDCQRKGILKKEDNKQELEINFTDYKNLIQNIKNLEVFQENPKNHKIYKNFIRKIEENYNFRSLNYSCFLIDETVGISNKQREFV